MFGLCFTEIIHLAQIVDIGHFKVIGTVLDLTAQQNVPIGDVAVPPDRRESVDALQHHHDALEAIGDLNRDRVELKPTGLLKVGELRDLLAIQPHFPTQAPGSQRRGLPVILHKTNVMDRWIDPECPKAVQVQFLRIPRVGLEDDLVLVELLHAIGVFAVPAVVRAYGGLHISHLPWLGPQHAQDRSRIHGPCAHLDIVGLPDQTALLRPELLQSHDHLLEIHHAPSSCQTRKTLDAIRQSVKQTPDPARSPHLLGAHLHAGPAQIGGGAERPST